MKFRDFFKHWIQKDIFARIEQLEQNILLQNGKSMCFVQPSKINKLNDAEFKVFSQWGEDGIIQWLIKKIPIINKTFIEFGVEDYEESNTRFLLMNNNWSGMVIDGSEEAINHIKNTEWFWRYDLKAVAKFITRENICSLLEESGFDEDLGILSVDIDGNDYWILRQITNYKPRILICEYNAVFGYDRAVSIPYKEDFYRMDAHYSNLYWGASLPAFVYAAKEKGYTLIGTNSSANNAFFIRDDLLKYIDFDIENIPLPIQKYRESRDMNGKKSFLSNLKDKQNEIADMKLVDVISNIELTVGDL